MVFCCSVRSTCLIYKTVLGAFATMLSKVKRVAPFGLCLDAKSIGTTRAVPGLPTIDLVLQSESVYWSIFGANSMIVVSDNVLLGFIDAGTNPMTSIIIGGHQLEDNFLVFDQARIILCCVPSLSLGEHGDLFIKN